MSTLTAISNPKERIAMDPYWLRQFTVTEYDRIIEAGILTTNDRVELLEGWIVNKMPQNPPHRSSVSRVNRWLGRVLPNNWTLTCQGPIALSDSEPEPDINVARGEVSTYDKRHPRPADIGVLIEVGDSTLIDDRRYKGSLYAREEVGTFWLINIPERKVELYTDPQGAEYRKKVEYTDAELVPFILDGVKIADVPVNELLPQP